MCSGTKGPLRRMLRGTRTVAFYRDREQNALIRNFGILYPRSELGIPNQFFKKTIQIPNKMAMLLTFLLACVILANVAVYNAAAQVSGPCVPTWNVGEGTCPNGLTICLANLNA